MANVQFKKGDVVKRTEENAVRNRTEKFGNGEVTAIVDRIEGTDKVWLTHGMWIPASDIELVHPYADLKGKKVRVTKTQGPFKAGEVHTVTGTGSCVFGKGVTTEEQGTPFCLAGINFEVVEEPKELDLRGLLQALYDGETVVSVEDGVIEDTYASLEDLDGLAQYEIEGCKFYLESEFKQLNPVIDFEEALKLLEQGIAVTSYDEDGDEIDTYRKVTDLSGMAGFEVEADWRKAE